jgi:hypothetical protein
MTDENVGTFPPNGATLAGQVRVLVGDTTAVPLETPILGQGSYAWYSDAELEILGTQFGSNPKRVAIWVLSIVPLNQAMLLKKWTTDDLAVDGPAIIAGMEKTLRRLSDEVAADTAAIGDDEFFGMYNTRDHRLYLDYFVPGVWGH